MRHIIICFILSIAVYLFAAVGSAFAANLDFNPESIDTEVDSTFSTDVVIDAGSQQIAGTDIYINYDPQYLELQSVTAGSYFPKVNNIPSSGKLYISGVIENQGEYKTGQGIVATVSFKAIKNGNTDARYDCNLTATETSKIVKNDINATNIITCGENGRLVVDIGGGGNDSNSNNGDDSSSSSDSNTDTLPKSGVYENVLQYSIPGMLLLLAGAALRIVIR